MMSFKELLLFFTIYSFLGWALETVFASIKERKFINRGFLTGFACPIYGFSAVFIILSSRLVTSFFENHYTSMIINIVFSIILVTAFEYITGFLMEKIFDCKWWDYSDNTFNLHGYICIKYSLLWGVLAFLLIQVVHPVISEAVYAIPTSVKNYLVVFLLIYFIADTSKSAVEAINLRKIILDSSNLSENKYIEKVIHYKRLLNAFPKLLILNADIINSDIRSIFNDGMDKIKAKLNR